jgi:protein-tyrosine phosphatase
MKGGAPIIAHAERYYTIIEDPNLLHRYIQMGCLIQVNVGSLLGESGGYIQRMAEILLTHQMGHIVASDMHTRSSIALGEGFEALSEIVGKEESLRLVKERPRAIIQNLPVQLPDPLAYRPKKRFENLWRLFSKPSPSRDDS